MFQCLTMPFMKQGPPTFFPLAVRVPFVLPAHSPLDAHTEEEAAVLGLIQEQLGARQLVSCCQAEWFQAMCCQWEANLIFLLLAAVF